MKPSSLSKHAQVFTTLEQEIREGKYAAGQRMPSESAIVQRFGVSRITAGRAVRDLQRAGLVERRAGSGTYVRQVPSTDGLSLGLLIPNLGETEIFEPICRAMAASPLAEGHALIWGNVPKGRATLEQQAMELARQYIARRVDGVFFAPVESGDASLAANRAVLGALEAAKIPVVLLDRGVEPYPDPSRQDLVGIDNRRAGFIVTRHLLRLGSRRIAFAAYEHAASTVDQRIAGFLEAKFWALGVMGLELILRLQSGREDAVLEFLDREKPEAVVCANDRTAGVLLGVLAREGIRVPQDLRIAGIDDVGYAALLPVPLTTVRQPVDEIGAAAMAAMVERIAQPDLPPRDILLGSEVVVRASCGAAGARGEKR